MRTCIHALFAILSPALSGDWKLVWSDEFNGTKLDYSKWGIEENAFGGGNHELQIYTDRPKNVRVMNGRLILEAHKDNAQISGTQRPYSSGRIRTKHRGDWQYGKIEVRAKLPTGQGLWPAIGLPTDEKYGTWAASGEIDIMEFKGQEPIASMAPYIMAANGPTTNTPQNSGSPTGQLYRFLSTLSAWNGSGENPLT